MTIFLIAGCVFAGAAALIHVLIFILESVVWLRPSTFGRFGITSADDARVLRPMAFNQGFYNLFLAGGAGLGVVLTFTGARDVGLGIALFALASMLLASLVLISSNRRLARAAALQGTAPLIAIVLLILAAVTA